MITFDNKIGLSAEDTAVIRERCAAQWQDAFKIDPDLPQLNTDAGTPAGQIIDAEAALVSEKDSELLYLARMFDPTNAEGMWQDALANIYFLTRHRARPTYVTCQVTGLYGTVIMYGDIVQGAGGYTFMNTAPVTIGADGTASISTRCTVWGPVEVGANTVNKIVTTRPGWDTVNNEAAGVTGIYEETQAEFENRRYESVAKNSHGAAASVFGAIANVDNVIACCVLENRSHEWKNEYGVDIAPHSLYISVSGGEETDIAKAIYNKLDGGCGTTGTTPLLYIPAAADNDQEGASYTYYIVRPENVSVGIDVTIRKNNSTPTTVAADIKNAIAANFAGLTAQYPRVKMASVLYASRFYKSTLGVGVDDLVKIQIRYPIAGEPADSVEIPANHLPVLDADDINVIILT